VILGAFAAQPSPPDITVGTIVGEAATVGAAVAVAAGAAVVGAAVAGAEVAGAAVAGAVVGAVGLQEVTIMLIAMIAVTNKGNFLYIAFSFFFFIRCGIV
jgi:hypothetical protein